MVTPARHPFRFGVQLGGPADAAAWVDQARRIEDLGYSTVTMPDHFTDELAPMPALSMAAAVTTTLRIGALVFDNDFRHPAVLAKELATQDVLSAGRVEVGLGAGWLESDYRSTGIAYDGPGVRIDRFEEAIAVLKGAFGEGPFSFAGAHYTITDLDVRPTPVQRPHPPLLVGGGGRRVLSIAAREADIVGINGNLAAGAVGPAALASMTHDAVVEKVRIVRDAAGDRLDDLELNIRAFMVDVTDDAARRVADLAALLQVEEGAIAESPFALIGTTASIVELLRQRRDELGISYVIVGGDDIDAFAPVVAELAGT
jgi:probable F420-dependent oxidoreductase